MLDEKGALDWQEAFIDGSFASAKKGAHYWHYQTGNVKHHRFH
jgi:hypothetical protein